MTTPYRSPAPPIGCSPEDELAFLKHQRDSTFKECCDVFMRAQAMGKAFMDMCEMKAAMLCAKVEHPKLLALLDRMCREAADAVVANYVHAMDLQREVDRLDAELKRWDFGR